MLRTKGTRASMTGSPPNKRAPSKSKAAEESSRQTCSRLCACVGVLPCEAVPSGGALQVQARLFLGHSIPHNTKVLWRCWKL